MVMNRPHGVEMVRDVILKPRPPLPSSSGAASPHPYLQTLLPFTIFDLATHDCHPSVLYAFRAPTPDNQTLADALAQTLYHYPSIAGSFTTDASGWPCVVLDDHGVRLIETRVESPLDEHLPFDPSSDLVAHLVPPGLAVRELCQVQLNRFSCGGLVICFDAHQQVADGHAIGSFLVAWAQTVSAASKGQPPAPQGQLLLQDQTKFIAPRNIPRCSFPHAETEFTSIKKDETMHHDLESVEASIASMVNVTVSYSKEFIARLKSDVLTGDGNHLSPPNVRGSTFQCILAHVWKNLTAARRLKPETITRVRIAVDGRARMRDPPVPASYFGNMVLWAFPSMTAGDLVAASYSEVVGVIRDALAKIDDEYFRSFIDFGELVRRGETPLAGKVTDLVPSAPVPGDVLCPDMEVDSWLGLDFMKLDFGGCRPCAMMPPGLPVEGLSLFLPSCTLDGGVDITIALKEEDAPTFINLSSGGSLKVMNGGMS